ncbi:DinB family protein [Paenibacillus endoradicis]|uniref:DinB family protein n=1 Tax=Paenibacillus endoradicis TaxID=2972487 RepID=UPI002158A81B|nr:DinB family protein [Paenibacillus endoradicis]MCR8656656.1 DinB family protein [Paenibacillus endoradicis]
MSNEIKELITLFEELITFSNRLKGMSNETWNSSIEKGKWTIKDIICHIMLWDKYFYEEAINKIASDEKITVKHLNYDEFNSNAMEYARGITTDKLIEQLVYYRKSILNEISAISEEVVAQNYIDGDGSIFNIPQYLKDFIWHDQHHLKPLKEYLEKTADCEGNIRSLQS